MYRSLHSESSNTKIHLVVDAYGSDFTSFAPPSSPADCKQAPNAPGGMTADHRSSEKDNVSDAIFEQAPLQGMHV